MRTLILVYGGSNLPPKLVRFVRTLTRALLKFPDVVLLSGGFQCYVHHPNHTSVDVAVLTEAERRLDADRFEERFETWLPGKGLDRRSAKRFRKGTVRELAGTAQARRFALVKAADGVITIAGEGQTRTVLEFALALAKPALPMPWSGGDSGRIWGRHRQDLIRPLRLSNRFIRRLERASMSTNQLDRLASGIATVVHDSAQRRCLVLMPFGARHDLFYTAVLQPGIERAGYTPHRIDRDEFSGNIESLFAAALERANTIVVDVTDANPNVMYELGHVHARELNPLLIVRRPLTRETYSQLPFYLQHQRLVGAPDNELGHKHLARELERYLTRLD